MSPSPSPTRLEHTWFERHRAAWMLGCVVLALLLRLPMLDRSVWFDEACMSDQRIGTWPQLLATLYVDIHPPLFVAFMHAWNNLFGDSEWSMRLPALLTGLLTIPALHWTGRRLVGDAAACFAVLLLALSPVHVWYSAEARLYAPMVLGTVLLFGTFDRLLDASRSPSRALWLAHLANVVVMLLLHYYLAVFVVALALLAPVVARGFPRPVRAIVLWHGVGILLLAGFVAAKQALGHFETSQDYLRPLGAGELAWFLADWCWTGNTVRPVGGPFAELVANVHVALGVLLIASGTIAALAAPRSRGWLVLVGVFALPAFLVVCSMLGYDRTYLERSMLPALPFVLLLAGRGLVLFGGRVQAALVAATLLFAVTALGSLYVHRDTHWTVYKPNGDWRGATAWLGAEIEAGGRGRPIYTSAPNPRPLSYYDERIQDEKNLAPAMAPDQIRRSVEKRLGATIGGPLGAYAERTLQAFLAHNERLRADARLVVHRADADPAALRVAERSRDGVFYLLRDEWHPHVTVDGSIEALLADPRIEILATQRFAGITIHRAKLAP
jgi:hypothetical protein